MFWTSSEVYPGFKARVDALACKMDSIDLLLMQHLLDPLLSAMQSILFTYQLFHAFWESHSYHRVRQADTLTDRAVQLGHISEV